MNAYLLQIAEKYVRWFLLAIAIIALLRGHNYPGGGFIGGLLAGLSVAYSGIAYSRQHARKRILMSPEKYLAVGLLCIILSFLPGLMFSDPFMKGYWVELSLPFDLVLKLGTPFLFDVGVFFIVIGVTIIFLFSQKMVNKWS